MYYISNLPEILARLIEAVQGIISTNSDGELNYYDMYLEPLMYDDDSILRIYQTMWRREFFWNWYENPFFYNITLLINVITGQMPELPDYIYTRYFQNYFSGINVSMDSMVYFTLSSISEIYIPYLNSEDRVLTDPVQSIIDIKDIDDLNNFLRLSGKDYHSYMEGGSKADSGFYNTYLINKLSYKIYGHSLFQNILGRIDDSIDYTNWIRSISNRVGYLRDWIGKDTVSFCRENQQLIPFILSSVLTSYLDYLVGKNNEGTIHETILILQDMVNSIINKYPSLYKDNKSQYLSQYTGHLSIFKNGIISELYNIFLNRGFNVGRDHIFDIYSVMDSIFPKLRSPENLEIIRGVYGANNSLLAAVFILNGVFEDFPILKRIFQMIPPCNPQVYIAPHWKRLGVMGMIISQLVAHLPEFYDHDSSITRPTGRLIHSFQLVMYDYFFKQGHNWRGIILEVILDGQTYVLSNLTSNISKNLRGLLLDIDISLFELVLGYFRNRPTLSFTGLRLFSTSPDDYYLDVFVHETVDRFRDFFIQLFINPVLERGRIDAFSIYSLSANSKRRVIDLLTNYYLRNLKISSTY